MKFANRNKVVQGRHMVFLLGAMLSGSVFAGAADYVYVPAVEQGEKEIDFKFGSAKMSDGTSTQVKSLGFGYGATEYWFTELYLKRESENGSQLSLAEWENKFQLTETGKYAVDAGLIVEIEVPINNGDEPYEFKLGPLLQKEIGKLQLNGNVLFERKFGQSGDYITEMGYQLQAKYRWQPTLEFGAQALGDMGEWNNLDTRDAQNRRVGPAVFGKIDLGNHQKIKYNAAWLIGSSPAAPDHTFRMQVEYEF